MKMAAAVMFEQGLPTPCAITRKGGDIDCFGLSTWDELYRYSHTGSKSEEMAVRGLLLDAVCGNGDVVRQVLLPHA